MTNILKHAVYVSNSGQVGYDLTLYNQNHAVMSQYLVRPALFDLYLGGFIFAYLGKKFSSKKPFRSYFLENCKNSLNFIYNWWFIQFSTML